MVTEAVVAIEGQAGDDGRVWTRSSLEQLAQAANRRGDTQAWVETRPDGRAQVRLRVRRGGPLPGRAGGMVEPSDLDRLRAASERRAARARKRAGVAGLPSPSPPAAPTTFRALAYDDE